MLSDSQNRASPQLMSMLFMENRARYRDGRKSCRMACGGKFAGALTETSPYRMSVDLHLTVAPHWPN